VAIQEAKRLLAELTASGNVQDSHLVPFSSRPKPGTYVTAKVKEKNKKKKNLLNKEFDQSDKQEN